MVNQQSIKQVLVVFTLEIVQTAVRRVADQRTIVGDQFTLVGMASEHLGYRPGIAGVDQRPAQTQAKRGAGRMMAHRKHVKPVLAMPKPTADRNQLERIPEIAASLGQHAGEIGRASGRERVWQYV